MAVSGFRGQPSSRVRPIRCRSDKEGLEQKDQKIRSMRMGVGFTDPDRAGAYVQLTYMKLSVTSVGLRVSFNVISLRVGLGRPSLPSSS